ncbi:MAG: hypothetical protein VX899_05675 [Myxococcota bacterium]|nr:hypothetical protein [Myxococcota bacterium]
MLTLLSALACMQQPIETDSTQQALAIHPQDDAVLTFLNDHQTDFLVLDDKVGLNARAAKQIVVYRDGPDWKPLTADDQPIFSIQELLDIEGVGESTLWDLRRYVVDPQDGWVVEGVPFSDEQADATVEYVNSASAQQLRELELRQDALVTVLDERPYSHVLDLAEGYGIGPATLTLLRDEALPQWPEEPAP